MEITVRSVVDAPAEKTWEFWTNPEHVRKWNNASPDWHTPSAENDLRPGGKFSYRMEARDGSSGFDFAGIYDEVKHPASIAYTIGDGRKVRVSFISRGSKTEIWETFDAEGLNTPERQRQGWQAILDNFKKYVENS